MQLATLRIHETEILSLVCPRIDGRSGAALVEMVASCVGRSARDVVLDFGHGTVVDFAGVCALDEACTKLDPRGNLYVTGLSGRARALVRSLDVGRHVRMVERWTDAVDPAARRSGLRLGDARRDVRG